MWWLHESSTIGDDIVCLELQEKAEIAALKKEYDELINAAKDRCPHKWEDGKPATYRARYGLNDYRTICGICYRRVD